MISNRTERLLTWILVGGLFIYVVVRAILVPITYDEASTFFRYINLGHYWPGDGLWDANNHILNSLLSIWSFRLFGADEIWLRLPNVLASIIYFSSAVALSSFINNRWLKWLILITLCCNHFVLEFFSVTRGYGLSMAFMLLSALSIYKWSSNKSIASLALGLAAMQLATLANLSLLVVNVLLLVWVLTWFALRDRTKVIPTLSTIVGSGWCLKWFVELSFEYKERGLLYYGSGAGIWDATLGSLAEFAFPGAEPIFPYFGVALIVLLLWVVISFFRKHQLDERLVFAYLFFGALAAVVFTHHFLDVNYPEDRVAMHFLVLIPLALIFLIDELVSEDAGSKANLAIMGSSVLLLIIPVNMVLSANLTHVRLWKEDACSRQFYQAIKDQSFETQAMPTVAGYRLRDLPLYYYGFKHANPINVLQDIGYQSGEADVQIAFLEEENLWSEGYSRTLYNKAAGLHLLKRKTSYNTKVWAEKVVAPQELSSQPYTVFYESDIDSMVGKDLLWKIELVMPELNWPFEAWITTDIGTPDGESVMQETVVLDWLKPTWKKGEVLEQKILMPNIPDKASHIKLFFWNIQERPIALGEARVRLIELIEE